MRSCTRALFALLVLTVLVTAGAGVAAQESAQPGAPEAAKDAAPASPSGAAFMKPLGRLSSILGSLNFLRTLCGDDKADVWRQKMSELLEAQGPNPADREILIASFNSGYRAFESTYRKCTPAARLAVGRYQEEGAVLAREISARYGN